VKVNIVALLTDYIVYESSKQHLYAKKILSYGITLKSPVEARQNFGEIYCL
jgi:hypothetical protein